MIYSDLAARFGLDAKEELTKSIHHEDDHWPALWLQESYRSAFIAGHFGRLALGQTILTSPHEL